MELQVPNKFKMNKMNSNTQHYYAFQYQMDGVTTYGLMPISKDAVYQMGFYNYRTKELVLQSKDEVQELKLVAKVDKFGQAEFENTKPAKGQLIQPKQIVERRLLPTNLKFNLDKDDIDWFIDSFVINPEVCAKTVEGITKHFDELKAKAVKIAENETIENKEEELLGSVEALPELVEVEEEI